MAKTNRETQDQIQFLQEMVVDGLINQIAEALDSLSDYQEQFPNDDIDVGQLLMDSTTSDADKVLRQIATSQAYRADIQQELCEVDDPEWVAQQLINISGGSVAAMKAILDISQED